MWYAIFMSFGISVGLGMMIWALIERKKRHNAEKETWAAVGARKSAEDVAKNNIRVVEKLKKELSNSKELEELLYSELRKVRDKILESENNEVVKEWIKTELKGGVL